MINKRTFIIVLIIVAFIWIPTGTPDDLLTTLPIIKLVGMKVFLIVTVILLFLLWRMGVLKALFGFLK